MIEELLALMNESIIYCHFKSSEHISDNFSGKSDFDILVHKEDLYKLEVLLIKFNFKRVNVHPYLAYPGVVDWLGFDENSGEILHFHIHIHLISGFQLIKEYIFPWSNQFLENREINNEYNMFVPKPEYEFVLLITRIIVKLRLKEKIKLFLGKYQLKRADFREYQFLCSRIKDSETLKEDIMALGFSNSEYALFESLISSFDLDTFRTIRRHILNRTKKYKRFNSKFLLVRSLYRALHYRILQILNESYAPGVFAKKTSVASGLFIVFIGCDGSGKSTISKELFNWLNWKLESELIYLGSGTQYLPFFRKIMKYVSGVTRAFLKRTEPNKKNCNISIKNERRQSIFTALYYLLYSFSVKRTLISANRFRLSGGIILADRYPQLEKFGIFDGPKVDARFKVFSSIERSNLSVINQVKPDIVFKLKVSLSKAIERKPDHSPDELREKIILVDELYEQLSVVDINSDLELKSVISEIKNNIWSKI